MSVSQEDTETIIAGAQAPPLIPAAGSLVIRDNSGAVVGAVGISGASSDEDRDCAEAGLAALSARPDPAPSSIGSKQ